MKVSSKKKQAENAELQLIIETFGRAMERANRMYVARLPECSHDTGINFTGAMKFAWQNYVRFCREHPND